MIPRRAANFANRLARALAPFFLDSDARSGAWSDNAAVSENFQYRLGQAFSIALHFRASSVVADQVFEFMLFPPGRSLSLKTTALQMKIVHSGN